MKKKIGTQTYHFPSCPAVVSYANAVGKKEGAGPLADTFDLIFTDTRMGQKTWEKGIWTSPHWTAYWPVTC